MNLDSLTIEVLKDWLSSGTYDLAKWIVLTLVASAEIYLVSRSLKNLIGGAVETPELLPTNPNKKSRKDF